MEVWFGGTSLTDASSCLGPSGRMDRPLVTPACGYWMLIRLVVALSFSDRAAAAGFRFVVASSFLDLAAAGGVTSHVHHAQELLQVREAVDSLLFFLSSLHCLSWTVWPRGEGLFSLPCT